MNRYIFSIIFNGAHHLRHNNYGYMLPGICENWAIAEGLSKPNGSTSWCNNVDQTFHNKGHSIDGTLEILTDIQNKNKNVLCVSDYWESKDLQCNAALKMLKHTEPKFPCFLWQIDIDEQWNLSDMKDAEEMLLKEYSKDNEITVAEFYMKHFVGKNLVVNGPLGGWGRNTITRLWIWKGGDFISHEPPVIKSDINTKKITLPQRFMHYAYYFEEDVKFKAKYYKYHSEIYNNWKYINDNYNSLSFPIPLSKLHSWGNMNGMVIEKEQ